MSPQRTNFNVSPYYDDFDSNDNYYKVLYKPGFPIQARELTSSQSILQNQLEQFGNNIFKQKTIVSGGFHYSGSGSDQPYRGVKLQSKNFDIDISIYLNNFLNKKIRGLVSGVTATIKNVVLPEPGNLEVDNPIIYLNYESGDGTKSDRIFEDGEELICIDNVTYGNTTIAAGTPFASLIQLNANISGSAYSINNGVVFVRGIFANVENQTIILDYYKTNPSYKVGLQVSESVVDANQDNDLFDNAKGFSNYAAPGADRFKLDLKLVKKPLDGDLDLDFVPLTTIRNGVKQDTYEYTQYNVIRDYIAKRTFEESGNYAVKPFTVSVFNSLNDNLGNRGIYQKNSLTNEFNSPSDDLMAISISKGKAYVKGYDIENISEVIKDVEKPRDVGIQSSTSVEFEFGNLVTTNNTTGYPVQGQVISLMNDFAGTGTPIGSARVYSFNLKDSAYENDFTEWDLRLFDIQTYTELTLNTTVSSTQLPKGSYIVGRSSGASGYTVSAGNNTAVVNVTQTSGTFIKEEQLEINGSITELSRSIKSVRVFDTKSILSFTQENSSLDTNIDFKTDSSLKSLDMPHGIDVVTITARTADSPSGISTVSSGGQSFIGIKPGDIIGYGVGENKTFNKVVTITSSGTELTIKRTDPNGAYGNALPAGITTTSVKRYVPILNKSNGLFVKLPQNNVSSVSLDNSSLKTTKVLTSQTVTSGGITLGLPGGFTGTFDSFDQEKYTAIKTTGTITPLNSDNFTYDATAPSLNGLSQNGSHIFAVTLNKTGIRSKVKNYNRSQVLGVTLSFTRSSGSNSSSSLNDGLTYDARYGLRVQDKEISLNKPDVSRVVAVYESRNSSAPTLDRVSFSSTVNVSTNAIIGENIVNLEKSVVARIVGVVNSDTLEVVYLSNDSFSVGDQVEFEESEIKTNVAALTPGTYKDITNNFLLDKGQRTEYCDYSRIVRKDSVNIPSKQLKIIFDCYTVSNDEGDVFTALSYDEARYSRDIPLIDGRVRSTDTLDFRPRVSDYNTSSSLSPFHFDSRIFNNSIKQFLVPNEVATLGIEYYLPRIDRLSVNTSNNFEYVKGVSSLNPVAPSKSKDPGRMDIATINLPAYLYNPQDAIIKYNDNRRYTMKDIGNIDDRLSELEELTSLNLLELSAQSLSIHDSANRDRFKCGIFADPLNDYSFIDEERSKCNLDTGNLLPKSSENTVKLDIVRQSDNSLFDSNLKETGNQITLNYEEISAIEQTVATDFENLNPFSVSVYEPTIEIVPVADFYTDGDQVTLEKQKRVFEKTRNVKLGGDDLELITDITIGDGGGEVITSRTSDLLKLTGSVNLPKDKDKNTVTNYVGTTVNPFARSRTVFFEAKGFPGNNLLFPFLGQYKSPDIFITPKLLQIRKEDGSDGSTGTFIVGEIVDIIEERTNAPFAPGYLVRNGRGTFRVCRPDHQSGPIDNPTETYITSPYDVNDRLSTTGYTQTTKTLNLDVLEAGTNFKSDFGVDVNAGQSFGGYALVGARIVGRESGAVAFVKSDQLVSDIFGTVQGSFHIQQERIPAGSHAFRITTSSQNLYPEASTTSDIVLTETYYTSGSTQLNFTKQDKVKVTKTELNFTAQNRIFTETIIENERRTPPYDNVRDPLGQTFFIEEPSKNPANANSEKLINSTDDLSDGVIVSSIDVWFRSAPTVPENENYNTEQLKNLPGTGEKVTLQLVETVGDGRPGRTILAESTLEQYRKSSDGTLINNIKTSTDANSSAYTRFSLNRLVYLEPGKLYAFVLKPGSSTAYEAYIATKDRANVTGTQIYRNEHAVGSLYKSANAFEWERDPYSDLTFRINVCNFTPEQGVLYLNNQDLTSQALDPNPLEPTPRTGYVNITPIPSSNTSLINILKNGRTILGGVGNTHATADIVSTGSAVAGISTTNSGTNYISGTSLDTVAITGQGTGLKLTITASGAISNTTVAVAGVGYQVGDQVGITTSQGRDAIFTVSSTDGGINRLYLDNILGDSGFWTANQDLHYLNDSGVKVGLANTDIISNHTKFASNQFAGNFIKVNHPDHGMYSRAGVDKVVLNNVIGNVNPTTLSAAVKLSDSSSATISVLDATDFVEFEGYPVGSDNNYGYVKIGEEIIAINAVDTTANTLTIQRRGVDGTTASRHPKGSSVSKYELNNISLIRINKRPLTMSSNEITADSYYLEVDLAEKTESGNSTVIALNRSSDGSAVSTLPKLSFTNKEDGGGNQVSVTKNIVYSEVSSEFAVLTPSGKSGSTTNADASVRTVTGRSIDGNETPYVDTGFESISIGDNTVKEFDNLRILASRGIENTQLTNIVDNRSVSVSINLSRSKQNALLSPILSKNLLQMQYKSYKLNSPIPLNAYDSNSAIKVFSESNDPHEFIYVSKLIKVENPADSLKVLVTAKVPSSSDFRVLYYIERADSSEISQSFELFPGYDNLRNDEDGEGLTPVDLSKNSGRSDVLVAKTEKGFREYEFSIDGLDEFTAFRIKIVASGIDQAKYPIFEDVRAIAIR